MHHSSMCIAQQPNIIAVFERWSGVFSFFTAFFSAGLYGASRVFFVGDQSPTPPRRFQRLFCGFFSLFAVFLNCSFFALRAFFCASRVFLRFARFFALRAFFCASRVLHIPRRFQQAPSRFWLQVKRLKPNACLDQRFQPILPQASNHRRIVGA